MKTICTTLLNTTLDSDIERVNKVISHFCETMLSGIIILLFIFMSIYSLVMMYNISKYYINKTSEPDNNENKENKFEIKFRNYNTSMISFILFSSLIVSIILLKRELVLINTKLMLIYFFVISNAILSWITYYFTGLRKYNQYIFFFMSLAFCGNILTFATTFEGWLGTIFSILAGLVILLIIFCRIYQKKTKKALQ